VTGVELDATTAQVAEARFAGRHEVIHGSFADVPLAKGQVAATIGNVPFGAYRLFDQTDNPGRRLSIHDHFLAKSARALAPGGIGVMVTSRYTMDAIDPAGREAIGTHADFVGAVRLPSAAHVQEAGCEVVTDIIVLRGRAAGAVASHVSGFTEPTPADLDGVRMSQYFVDHPGQVLGQVTSRTGRYSTPEMHIGGTLDDALDRLPAALNRATAGWFDTAPGPLSAPPQLESQRGTPTWDVPGAHRLNEAVPEVYETGAGWVPVAKQAPEAAALIRVRDALDATLADDQAGRDATEARSKLQAAYSAYRGKYGAINRSKKSATGRVTRPSQGGFRSDPRWPAVSAVEVVDHATGEVTPARLIEAPVEVNATAPTSAVSDADALNIALGHTQRVDVDFIGQLRNEPGQDVLDRLERTGAVFCDPTTAEWITRSDFLSGPVRTRHAAVEALDDGDPRKEPYLAEIEAVLPAPASADDLYDTFGGPWIPVDLVNEFVNTRIGGQPPKGFTRMCDITWDSRGGWNTIKRSGAVTARWETDRVNAHSLVEAALNGTSVTVRDSDGDGNSWVNEAATAEASDMIAQIREEWDRWAFEDPDRARAALRRVHHPLSLPRPPRLHPGADRPPGSPVRLPSAAASGGRDRPHPPVRRQPVGPPGGRWEDRRDGGVRHGARPHRSDRSPVLCGAGAHARAVLVGHHRPLPGRSGAQPSAVRHHPFEPGTSWCPASDRAVGRRRRHPRDAAEVAAVAGGG
jgi:hypothetical protein